MYTPSVLHPIQVTVYTIAGQYDQPKPIYTIYRPGKAPVVISGRNFNRLKRKHRAATAQPMIRRANVWFFHI